MAKKKGAAKAKPEMEQITIYRFTYKAKDGRKFHSDAHESETEMQKEKDQRIAEGATDFDVQEPMAFERPKKKKGIIVPQDPHPQVAGCPQCQRPGRKILNGAVLPTGKSEHQCNAKGCSNYGQPYFG